MTGTGVRDRPLEVEGAGAGAGGGLRVVRGKRPWADALMGGRLSGLAMRWSRSSTAQMRGLALAEARPPSTTRGLALGIEVLGGWPVFHDPFTLYGSDGFSSPNVVVFGDLGSGKSVSAKTWVMRNLMVGRRVVVVDKKLQDLGGGVRAGEYSAMARALGFSPVTLKVGEGGLRINILDPAIAGDGGAGLAGQQLLLEAVAAAAVGRPLSERERKALRVARRAAVEAAAASGRVAHVGDVTRTLLSPDPGVGALAGVEGPGELAEWGRDIGFALERLVSEELAGLIDGPTDPAVAVDGALTVFDISSLPDEGPAVGVMMTVLNTWLHAMVSRTPDTVPTLFVVDEAWHVADGDFARIARKNAKLARGLGMSNMTILQHPGDIHAGSPAVAMIQEAQTAFVFRQDKLDDARAVCALFGWDEQEWAGQLQRLRTGVCAVKIGMADPLVCAWRASDFELAVATTDAAMTSRATLASIYRALTQDGPGPEEGGSGVADR